MQSLREMQIGFAAALFNPGAGGVTPGIHADGISPATRLRFYRTNVFENYRRALRTTFAATEKVVGGGFFTTLADEYIRSWPSHSGDVGRHGERFPEFLRRHHCSRELPYLADLASLEWCIDESFNEADSAPLAAARLTTVSEEHLGLLRFQLAPTVRLMRPAFPVNRIWNLCQPGHEYDGGVDLDEDRDVDLLIRRQGFEVVVEVLGAADFAMLMALAEGSDFASAYERALKTDPRFDPAAFLQKHLMSGALVDFTLPAEALAP